MKRLLLLALALAIAGCDASDDSTAPSYEALFEIEIATGDGPETFRVAVATPEQAALAESARVFGRVGVLHGTLVHGDGGFNADYSWHLAPESITFPDLAIEVCDGRPLSDVEANLDYWFDALGIYCPWGARVIRRID